MTPLFIASQEEHEQPVEILLEKGKKGASPLWIVAQEGHEQVVELLLEKGNPNIDLQDQVFDILFFVCLLGFFLLFLLILIIFFSLFLFFLSKLFFELLLIIFILKKNGVTPLCVAAENGYEQIIKILLETGKANVNLQDQVLIIQF